MTPHRSYFLSIDPQAFVSIHGRSEDTSSPALLIISAARELLKKQVAFRLPKGVTVGHIAQYYTALCVIDTPCVLAPAQVAQIVTIWSKIKSLPELEMSRTDKKLVRAFIDEVKRRRTGQ